MGHPRRVSLYVRRQPTCPSCTPTEGATWSIVAAKVDEFGIPIYHDSRAVELIANTSGGVIGATTEDGRSFKEKKGALLTQAVSRPI